jgi:hypothetical protein
VHGFDELDYNRHLGLAGYKLEVSHTDVGGDIEAVIGGRRSAVIELVRAGGPAEKAGLSNGDVIVAIDGLKVNAARRRSGRSRRWRRTGTRSRCSAGRGCSRRRSRRWPAGRRSTRWPAASATYEQLLLRQAWLGFAAPAAPADGASNDQLREAAMKLFKGLDGPPEQEDAVSATAPPAGKKGKKKPAAKKPAKPAK